MAKAHRVYFDMRIVVDMLGVPGDPTDQDTVLDDLETKLTEVARTWFEGRIQTELRADGWQVIRAGCGPVLTDGEIDELVGGYDDA